MTPILVFDIETIPDVDGIRRLDNLPATLTDIEVAEHAFAARRSVFVRLGAPLMVTECFLPSLWSFLARRDSC